MSDAELDAFYQQEYRQLYQGSPGPSPKDLAVQVDRAGVLVSFAQGLIPRIESHLDIGCSAGLLLQGFQHAYGCRSVGVEPGTAYREYVQAQGLTVFASLDDLPPTRFDLVSLAHVLEHIPDPRAYLARLRQEWLAQTGWLLVEVPNLYGHDCFEPAHLVSYSPHTLEQMLKQAGFQVRACDIHGRPRSAILPLYITVLAQPLDSGLSPDVGQAVSLTQASLNQASLNQASLAPSGVSQTSMSNWPHVWQWEAQKSIMTIVSLAFASAKA